MTLVADSGSTKTTWAIVETGNKAVTEGLNPHFTSEEQFLTACQQALEQLTIPNALQAVYFYGAGCGLAVQKKRVAQWLTKAFGTNDVAVETDMLAACRATTGQKPAVVGILGTGSNACLYDGTAIKYQPTSTGYILGDYGSANHVGRMLLDGYLTHRMPANVRRLFHDSYKLSNAQLIDAVYHRPNPNRFLASLAPFAVAHQEEDYCHGIVTEALRQWYFEVIIPLLQSHARFPFKEWDGAIHVVGGFAKAIETHLTEKFHDGPLYLASVVSDTIDGLVQFHRSF